MLAVRDLNVRYGGIVALRGVSIEVKKGETVLLVGANGRAGRGVSMIAIGVALVADNAQDKS